MLSLFVRGIRYAIVFFLPSVSLHIMRDLQTDMVVSLCFDGSVASMSECPQSKLQVSVLSRQPVMTDLDRWLTIISSLPGHVNSIDSSSGGMFAL